MIPAVPPIIKVMTVLLAGSLVLSPVPSTNPQAGKITNKITDKIIEKSKDKRNQIDDPSYKPKKIPITGGFKPGHNPLPEGTTPAQNYINAWNLLKKELGLK